MLHATALPVFLTAAGGAVAFVPSPQDAFVVETGALPTGAGVDSSTENVDWGDLDLDGDWDVAVADGGDSGNDQNRLWVNQGGLQGGVLGTFLDVTATQAPSINDTSRDVEFADFDADGDLDLAVANSAQFSIQSSRLWTNLGLAQGGTTGFYQDDTATRWVGLGGPGSSIAASLVLPAGGFVDWCDDIDFGDLDHDGDLDLVHTSASGSYGGTVPTRLFLNDGQGFFSEFNPSGVQLSGTPIPDGTPGLWCDGIQLDGTLDTTGTQCDVNAAARDVDIGDLDGDFDLDLVLDDENGLARVFLNRLDASSLAPAAGGLAFRDVTGAVFQPGTVVGGASFEHELGDLDGDGDLDLYGVDWQFSFWLEDVLLENQGDGTFGPALVVPGAGFDGGEADFLDYDEDGDLDIYVAMWSGGDLLYRNDGGPFGNLTQVPVEAVNTIALDADAADADGDGDLDAIVGMDVFKPNVLMRNETDVADATPPYLPRVEALGDQVAAAPGRPLRAQVYDNRPYYQTWYADVTLEVSVDGMDLPPIAASSSAGQIFRALLPGNLVGAVDYRFQAVDERGNAGVSASQQLMGSTPLAFASSYGAGTAGLVAGSVPSLQALSVPFGGSTFYLGGHSDAPPGTPVFFVASLVQANPAVPIGGLVLSHLGVPIVLVEGGATDAAGDAVLAVPVPPASAGLPVYFQFAVGDPTAGGDLLSTSAGLEIVLP